jgi:hypothetical protein
MRSGGAWFCDSSVTRLLKDWMQFGRRLAMT